MSFVRHIFDSDSDRLRRRLGSVRRVHDVDFETASCRFTHLMDRALAWTCWSRFACRACEVEVSRLEVQAEESTGIQPSSCGIGRAEGEIDAKQFVYGGTKCYNRWHGPRGS